MAAKSTQSDLTLDGGRVLHVYDVVPDGSDGRLIVVWHAGTPNTGAPPEPLFAAAARLGIRWVSYDRPGYGGSTPNPGRDVASAAADTAAVTDALGIRSFAVMGHSGGGPHALSCGALLPDRVLAVLSGSSLAPYKVEGLDWFAGMAESGRAGLTAAVEGRAAKERHEAANAAGDSGFTDADVAALAGPWGWFLSVVEPAIANGPGPLIDDDLAFVAPWGFDPAQVTAPVLILHGAADRVVPASHGRWLAERCPAAELWIIPNEGHISVLPAAGEAALERLAALGAGR